MLEWERDIVARYALGLRQSSDCESPEAAVVARGFRIFGAAASRGIGAHIDTSAIVEAVLKYYMVFNTINAERDWAETVLFTTVFPKVEEFSMLLLTNIRTVYHFKEVDDESAVKFLNKLTKARPEDGFQIIRLKFSD